MFAPANLPRFTLTLDSGPNDLKVLEFKGKEAISQPYCFELELVSERPDLPLEELLHRQAFLGFDDRGGGIHGQVYAVAQGDSGKRLTRYQITLVPRLAYLRHRINQRIFQHLSVPDIVALVLKDHGILADAFQFSLGGQYPEREYCVQYGEATWFSLSVFAPKSAFITTSATALTAICWCSVMTRRCSRACPNPRCICLAVAWPPSSRPSSAWRCGSRPAPRP